MSKLKMKIEFADVSYKAIQYGKAAAEAMESLPIVPIAPELEALCKADVTLRWGMEDFSTGTTKFMLEGPLNKETEEAMYGFIRTMALLDDEGHTSATIEFDIKEPIKDL